MQIDGSSDSDAILLAVSSVLMNIATTKASASGASKSAELTSFLSQFSLKRILIFFLKKNYTIVIEL